MNEEDKFETLKKALFMCGSAAIEDFLGFPICTDDKDAIENLMDGVYAQMPPEEFDMYYHWYVENP